MARVGSATVPKLRGYAPLPDGDPRRWYGAHCILEDGTGFA